jgi:hypothetical protein
MNSLLDTMYIKRFCLTSNTDISSYISNDFNNSSRVSGKYNHVSCVLLWKELFEKG